MPRPRVKRWVSAPGAPRIWVLQAGPGSGKAATAHLLGESLGRPIYRMEPGRHHPARLATWLGLAADAAPERVADTLHEWALRDVPGGATFMVPRVDEPGSSWSGTGSGSGTVAGSATRDGNRTGAGTGTGGGIGPHGEAFLRRWLEIADPRYASILTTRTELPWFPPRLVGSGEAAWLGAPDLWFDPEEAGVVLAGLPVRAEAIAATCGWPLGIASLARLASNPGVLTFLEDLAAAELLDTLPGDLKASALELWPVPEWQSADVPLGDPELGRALAWLVRWGLMVLGPAVEAIWHPLVRRALRMRHDSAGTPEERKARMWRLGRWLEGVGPGRAFDYWLGHGEMEAAVGCLVRQVGAVPPAAERDRAIASWLDRLPRDIREGDPRVLLAEGSLMLRRGSHGGAAERLLAARAGFRHRADAPAEFATLSRLLCVSLQREDVPGGKAVAAEADPLEEGAEIADRVVYQVNRGSLEFLAGDEEGCMRHYRRALDYPQLGRSRIALAQQEACLNLAILAYERGELGQTRRALDRAVASHADFPIDPSLPLRAGLQQALAALALGDHATAAGILDFARAAERPANPYHLAICLRLEGQTMMLLRRHDEAGTSLRAALDALHGQGLDGSGDAAATLAILAELARRKEEFEAARVLLDWAAPLAAGLPRLRASILYCRALVDRATGRGQLARDALHEAGKSLTGVVARPLGVAVALAAAVVDAELGDRPAAERHVAVGATMLREGPYYFLPLGMRDIAPQVWALLAQGGHQDILAAVAARFPRAAAAVRAEASGLQATAPATAPASTPANAPASASQTGAGAATVVGAGAADYRSPAPLVEIRTFGQVSVKVGSVAVGFQRRKARALLAHLLLAPGGMTRDEAAEVLYPDLDWDDARHQVDNLTSSLRRAFTPEARRGGEPGVLRKEDGRYRLDLSAVWWDARVFDEAFEAGTAAWNAGNREVAVAHYAEALELYVDDLCAGPDLADWFEPSRQAYRGRSLFLLERSAEHHLGAGCFEAARSCAERILKLEPAHEGAHRLLMRVYARLGESGLVRRQFDLCAQSLARHLDVAPSAETRALLADLTVRLS